MSEFLDFIVKNPMMGAVILALMVSLAILQILLVLFKKGLGKEFHHFGTKLSGWQIAISSDMLELRESIANHSVEMLGLQKSLERSKLDLILHIGAIKIELEKMEASLRALAETSQSTNKNLSDVYGKVLKTKEEIDLAYGRIILLEERSESFSETHTWTVRCFEKVSQALNAHKEEIAHLKKGQAG